MKRDLTFFGIGFLLVHLVFPLVVRTNDPYLVPDAIMLAIALFFITGSRFGLFGRTTITESKKDEQCR